MRSFASTLVNLVEASKGGRCLTMSEPNSPLKSAIKRERGKSLNLSGEAPPLLQRRSTGLGSVTFKPMVEVQFFEVEKG